MLLIAIRLQRVALSLISPQFKYVQMCGKNFTI